MKNNKLAIRMLGVFIGLGAIYYMASQVVPKTLITLTKAQPGTTISLNDSYVLGEKILARADGKDKCLINVFVMDSSGKGVMGKRVELLGAEGITPVNDVSNKEGKTSFTVTSVVEGQYNLEASIEGIKMNKGIKITFRN